MENITVYKNNTTTLLKQFCEDIKNHIYLKTIPVFLQNTVYEAIIYLEETIKYLESESNKLVYYDLIGIFEHCIISQRIINIIYGKIIQGNDANDSLNNLIIENREKYQSRLHFTNIHKSIITKLKRYTDTIHKYVKEIFIHIIDDGKLDLVEFNNTVRKYKYSWVIYSDVMQYILDADDTNFSELQNSVVELNEANKSTILNTHSMERDPESITQDLNNPPLLRYGLIPISDLMELNEIATVLSNRKIKNPIGNIMDFAELCKKKSVDLILIKKYLGRGIYYNITDLLDYAKSKSYNMENGVNSGVNISSIKRMDTIQYVSPRQKGIGFTIDYQYILETRSDKILILEELYPDKYHIMSDDLDLHNENKYITEKSGVKEFISFIKNEYISGNRIHDYNSVMNRFIMKNIYLKEPANLDNPNQNKTYMKDITYLKYNIKKAIVDQYDVISKGGIKSLYHFSKIIHMDIFVNTIVDHIYSEYEKYSEYLVKINNRTFIDNKSDIYNTVLYTITNYKQDYIKRTHDYFIEMNLISDDVITNDTYKKIFEEIVTKVLDTVLSDKTNLYSTVNDKIEIWKILT